MAASLRARLWRIRDHICVHCRCELSWDNATTDHVVPRSKGGRNNLANLELACFRCNNRRGSRDFREFQISVGGIYAERFIREGVRDQRERAATPVIRHQPVVVELTTTVIEALPPLPKPKGTTYMTPVSRK